MAMGLPLWLTACQPDKVYDHRESVSPSGWAKADSFVYAIPPMTEGGYYTLSLAMRTGRAFPFRSVAVSVKTYRYPKRTQKHQLIVCNLVDQSGNPIGAGVTTFQNEFPIDNDLTLKQGDSLRITLRHGMSKDKLQGITDIGIILRKKSSSSQTALNF